MERREINLARRVLDRFHLSPPVEIKNIVQMYADVVTEHTPPGVDGICLNPKHRTKRPLVILNEDIKSPARIRFTLAHELGHILLPLHFGDFVDQLGMESDYSLPLEAEANRFASEVLLPSSWLTGLCATLGNPTEIVAIAARRAKVSMTATCIKVVSILPTGYVFAMTDESSKVLYSGVSPKTFARPLQKNSLLTKGENEYPTAEQHWARPYNNGEKKLHWWKLKGAVSLSADDIPDWKVTLNKILDDSGLNESDAHEARQSIGGVFGALNSAAKIQNLNEEERLSLLMTRLQRQSKQNTKLKSFYVDLLQHPLLAELLQKRLKTL